MKHEQTGCISVETRVLAWEIAYSAATAAEAEAEHRRLATGGCERARQMEQRARELRIEADILLAEMVAAAKARERLVREEARRAFPAAADA